jgi:hypothetical protein
VIDTSRAAEELLIASLPPVRQPLDMERSEVEDTLRRNGYVVKNRYQVAELLRSAGFISLQVWDNEKRGPVTVWRLERT